MSVRDSRPVEAPGYRLIRWLGTTGAASVYIATERSSGQQAAVKIFHPIDAPVLERLEQRLRTNAKFSHPHIVRVNQIGRTTDGRLFYSMPLLLNLEQARHDLLGRPLRIAALLRGVLEGLDHAHHCGTVHGGIKPSNVLFDGQGRAQLADFGIARCMARSGLPSTDAERYLSPEQVQGKAPTPGMDLYGVGMLAYELLAGESRVGTSPVSAASTTRPGQPVPPLPPDLAWWQAWVDRALARSPEQRFQSAREMSDALNSMMSLHAAGERGHVPEIAPFRRAPRWWPYAAILATVVVALVGWAMSEHRHIPVIVTATSSAAASSSNPDLPIFTTPPASALPAAADSASSFADRVQGLITAADALRAQGHLFSPPFHNAASRYLAALALDPGNADATAGIAAMLTTLRGRLDKAWRDTSDTRKAAEMLQQGDELAEHVDAPARRAWRRYHAQLARQVGAAVVQAADAHDTHKVSALRPLAKALPAKWPSGFDLAKAQQVASAPPRDLTPTSEADAEAPTRVPAEPKSMRDPHGPQLVYVPASDNAPAFAIAKYDVTLTDYAAFARATGRPAAKCREAHNPVSWLRHLSWQSPGFAQSGDHPVVCVSWNDAVAYAAWLSKQTGQDYRLASSSQWLRAARGIPQGSPCQLGNVDDVSRHGRFDNDRWSCDDGAAETAPVGRYAASAAGVYGMYGNVSQWVAGGSPDSRPFRGISWRDGSHESALGSHGTASANVGYNSVGFRVVRTIDTTHPAPTVASGG